MAISLINQKELLTITVVSHMPQCIPHSMLLVTQGYLKYQEMSHHNLKSSYTTKDKLKTLKIVTFSKDSSQSPTSPQMLMMDNLG